MSKPKAVIINDIHYNITNLELADKATQMAVDEAERLGVPLIIAGDLHDTKASMRGECVKAMMTTLGTGDHHIILLGNHDLINERSKEHSLEFLRVWNRIVYRPYHDEQLDIHFIPYQHDPEEFISILSTIPKGSTIICHQGVTGSYGGHYIHDKSAVPKEIFADYRVISGHYHRAQDIKCGRPRKGALGLFSYTGSPYTMSFSEANDGPKGFHVLHEDGTLTMVPTNLREHVVMDLDISYAKDPWPRQEIRPDDTVWIKVRGSRSELATINKKELGMKLIGHSNYKLDLIPTDSEVIEVKKDMTGEEILDTLIEGEADTQSEKAYLKSLWRKTMK